MIRGRCPTCSKPYAIAAIADLPTFPFCTDRCRLIDLGRWIDGAYTIPGPEGSAQPGTGEVRDEETEDD
jgi:uncharacterized protein